jgi:methionine sulfoxide reductase heme-binding subunit
MAKAIDSWRLFWVLALAITTANCLALPFADFHTAPGTQFIVLYAMYCALPFFLVAFTASSLATLWPNRRTRWLLSNRRYFGLAYAFGMGWHFIFVGYSTFSFGNRLRPSALMLDIIGLCFLLAMTLSSFRRFARRISFADWRRLHKTGVYVLWFLPTYFYLENVRDFPEDRDPFHFGMLGVLLAVLALRGMAWVRKSISSTTLLSE